MRLAFVLAVSLLLLALGASGSNDSDVVTSQDSNTFACLLKYGSIGVPGYCLCVAGVSENFACNYDCSCNSLGLNCEASACQITSRAVSLIVVSSVSALLGVCSCCVLCCYLSRNRRRHVKYVVVNHHELPVYEPHIHHQHQHQQFQKQVGY